MIRKTNKNNEIYKVALIICRSGCATTTNSQLSLYELKWYIVSYALSFLGCANCASDCVSSADAVNAVVDLFGVQPLVDEAGQLVDEHPESTLIIHLRVKGLDWYPH